MLTLSYPVGFHELVLFALFDFVADPALIYRVSDKPAAHFLPVSKTEGESNHHLGISISFIFIGVETKQKGLD